MRKKDVVVNSIIAILLVSLCLVSFLPVDAKTTAGDGRVVYFGDESKPNISIMINVYQGENEIMAMLDILDTYKVKTTFFVGGCWAVNHIDLLKEIYARGHELANHGFYHKDQDKMTLEENLQEIKMCHEVVKENLGIEMELFAPPSGAYDKTTVDAAEILGYTTIMWTHDTIDWRDQNEDLIYKRAIKDMSNGDLILMHPTKKSVDALTNILATAINSGFTPTTVSQCL